MTKLFLIVLFLISNQCLFAQQILKCNQLLTDIDLICEYFSDCDSVFAGKNSVLEIKVTESYFNHGVLKYERTKLKYKYDNQFKKTYSEVNLWAEDGILIRGDVTLYNKDSIINSQLVRNSYDPNKNPSFTNYVTKMFWLNDTLLKRVSYTFLDGSLYRYEDLGIEDTRAEIREFEKLKKIPAEPIVVENLDRSDIFIHSEPEYFNANPPEDAVIKDSLDRITEIESFFITEVGGKRGSFPGKKYYIEYLDSTKIIKRIKAFHDFNTNKGYFEEMIKTGLNNSLNHFWPQNYSYNNLFFEYTASNFKFGIPQLVVISLGKDSTTKRIYETIISTR